MGRIDLILTDELENQLRMEVGKRMGVKRGNLTKAITEAIEGWIENEATRKVKDGKKK